VVEEVQLREVVLHPYTSRAGYEPCIPTITSSTSVSRKLPSYHDEENRRCWIGFGPYQRRSPSLDIEANKVRANDDATLDRTPQRRQGPSRCILRTNAELLVVYWQSISVVNTGIPDENKVGSSLRHRISRPNTRCIPCMSLRLLHTRRCCVLVRTLSTSTPNAWYTDSIVDVAAISSASSRRPFQLVRLARIQRREADKVRTNIHLLYR
jgi:hypothetical protein